MISLLVVLIAVFVVFKVLDKHERVIERKTGFDVPEYCTIEEYVAGGSLFHRKSFETKIRIDTSDHMFEIIAQLHDMLGENHDELSLSEFNSIKYQLFEGMKLIPNPSSSCWESVGDVKDGKLVVFICIENDADYFLYMYYSE